MPVDIVGTRHAVPRPGLPQHFIITKAALIKAHIKAGNFMGSIVHATMDDFVLTIHKPVMTRAVHLNKLTLPRPFIARFMLLLFFSRPGPRRFDPGIREDLPDHMIRDN